MNSKNKYTKYVKLKNSQLNIASAKTLFQKCTIPEFQSIKYVKNVINKSFAGLA